MTGFSKLLALFDAQRSPDGLFATIAAVCTPGASLVELVDIGEAPPRAWLEEDPLMEEMLRRLSRARERALTNAAGALRGRLPEGVEVRHRCIEAQTHWHALAAHAERTQADLVLLASDGGPAGPAFGSLSQHLFRKCVAPVWSVTPSAPVGVTKVLVALDACSGTNATGEAVMRFAAALRAATGAVLHVAHAWNAYAERLIRLELGDAVAHRYLARAEGEAGQALARTLETSGATRDVASVSLLHGRPEVLIPRLADELDVDAVVLGNCQRSGERGFLIGSTAETLLARIRRSVVVVKAHGFAPWT